MKKVLLFVGFVVLSITLTDTVQAQWGVGASYEVRSEEPENGFGFRVERGFLSGIPILDFNVRAHFSYFNDENNVTRDDIIISREITVYDYGLAAIAGLLVPPIKPYFGLGIGNQNYKFDADIADLQDDSSFYWNGFGGIEFQLLPVLKPFIEFRIARLTGSDEIEFDNVNRLAFGVNLRF